MATQSNVSQARQNYHAESEAAVNRQINLQLTSSYTYSSLSAYFDRDDVALHGFSSYFKKRSDEKRDDADKLMKYQNMRGGRIVLGDLKRPERDEWGTGQDAMLTALQVEKNVNASLLEVHKISSKHGDAQMCDFVEEEFLESEAKLIKEMADYATNLKRVGAGLGEYQLDRSLL